MNTKRYLSLVLMGIVIILPFVTTSCFKKGEEDPFVSIYTRKARITGKWNVSEMESKIRYISGDIQTLYETMVNGLNWKQDVTDIGTNIKVTHTGKVLEGRNWMQFDKDGKVTSVYEYEYTVIDQTNEEDENPPQTIYKIKEELKGTWNFLGGIDEYKDKERLAVVIEERKTTTRVFLLTPSEDDETVPTPVLQNIIVRADKFANGQMSTIWTIKMLKYKDMILHQNVDLFYVADFGSQGSESYQELGYKTTKYVKE